MPPLLLPSLLGRSLACGAALRACLPAIGAWKHGTCIEMRESVRTGQFDALIRHPTQNRKLAATRVNSLNVGALHRCMRSFFTGTSCASCRTRPEGDCATGTHMSNHYSDAYVTRLDTHQAHCHTTTAVKPSQTKKKGVVCMWIDWDANSPFIGSWRQDLDLGSIGLDRRWNGTGTEVDSIWRCKLVQHHSTPTQALFVLAWTTFLAAAFLAGCCASV